MSSPNNVGEGLMKVFQGGSIKVLGKDSGWRETCTVQNLEDWKMGRFVLREGLTMLPVLS